MKGSLARSFAALLGIVFLLAVTAVGAVEPRRVGVTGTPPPGSTTWILLGTGNKKTDKKTKASLGAQLHSAVGDPFTITPDLNPTLEASGFIAGPGPFPDCFCDWHFHGSLLGFPDPAENACGWGCVGEFESAPDVFAFLSGAIMFEARALKKVVSNDLAGAAPDVQDGIEALDDFAEAVDAAVTNDGMPQKLAKKMHKMVDKVKKMDAAVVEDLEDLLGSELTPRQRERTARSVTSTLKKAVEAKQKAMGQLLGDLEPT